MPPRLNLLGASRSLLVRSRPLIARHKPTPFNRVPYRGYTSEMDSKPTIGSDPNLLGHVNEEAAEMSKVMGEAQPDLSQATPVQEVVERDQESKLMAPEVMKNEIQDPKLDEDQLALERLWALAETDSDVDTAGSKDLDAPGHLFGVPKLPLPSDLVMKYRYDPLVHQFTNMIMKHGKLSVAQGHMSKILNHLRMSPPPTPNPAHPLLPGAPPPEHLPLNPVLYLTLAVDSVAPLTRIRSQKGAAGGGAALSIPVALGLRERRRTAIVWILNTVNTRQARSNGRGRFPQRVAEELIAVIEGRSSAWVRRAQIHKDSTASRINVNWTRRKS